MGIWFADGGFGVSWSERGQWLLSVCNASGIAEEALFKAAGGRRHMVEEVYLVER